MLERGHGLVVKVASNAAFQPSPYFDFYGAAKSFVLNVASHCPRSTGYAASACTPCAPDRWRAPSSRSSELATQPSPAR
ncbi:hypothetical protein [Streptomyces sp. LMG1-1-1.1]|uniref:hypothetical protein n=1 Tax=Streptomyces sp. LMG1-1-1.1 TaxID=3135245 RepID=UPI003464FA57